MSKVFQVQLLARVFFWFVHTRRSFSGLVAVVTDAAFVFSYYRSDSFASPSRFCFTWNNKVVETDGSQSTQHFIICIRQSSRQHFLLANPVPSRSSYYFLNLFDVLIVFFLNHFFEFVK